MKKYISNLYGHDRSSTAMMAQKMVSDIAKKVGYSEVAINAYAVSEDTEEEKVKRIEGMLASVQEGSLFIAQLPSWNGIAFDEVLLKILCDRVDHLVVFVHDFVPLMFVNNAYLMERYLTAYNLADLVVLPSPEMKKVLQGRGLNSPTLYQELWDHLSDVDLIGIPPFKRKIKFAGSITRFPFVKNWSSDIPLEVFSNGAVDNKGFIEMKGWQHDDQLLRELHQGGFGLVWSENIENQFEREYSKMNLSFKLSTYLAAGIPIIVNRGLAKEGTVSKYGLGYVADNLSEASEFVKSVSEGEYQLMCRRVNRIGHLVREGFFTQKLLLEVEKNLFL